MGHYDSCRASDYADKREVTDVDVIRLKRDLTDIKREIYYQDDSNSVFLLKVAMENPNLFEVGNSGHGMFYIQLKEEETL